MNWISLPRKSLGLLGSLLLPAVALHAAPPALNVLVILSDDQGYCELGSYMDFASADNLGSEQADRYRAIEDISDSEAPIDVCFAAARKCMPRIDALAAQGVRFTNFHAAPTCAPSRTALMTGRYPQTFGVYANDDVIEGGANGIPAEVKFPAVLFREAGYMTGIIGKWHLGSKLPGQHPNDRGFEYYFGFDRAHTDKYDSKILYRNREKVPAEGWLADQISGEAVAFVERAHEDQRPFFLYVAYNEPHGPTPRPPQAYIDHINSGSEVVDIHFASIYGMDQGIGRILDELKRTGELENTLIIYGSDNGLAQGSYHFGFKAGGEANLVGVPGNGPLRGCKWTPWEGGVRVPFIARLPGGQAKSSAALASIMDVMPTALAYAGIDAPASYKLNGASFLPILTGESEGDAGRTLFWAADAEAPYPEPEWNARYGQLTETGKSKQNRQLPRQERNPPGWFVLTPKWKLIGWDTVTPALIDMVNDPYEREDVAAQNPGVVATLHREFQDWLAACEPPANYSRRQWAKLFVESGE